MKKILFIALSVFFLIACTNKERTIDQDTTIEAAESNTAMGVEAWENIFSAHPDSLTAEQKEAKRKLLPIIVESIVIKDNSFHSTLTREDFKKHNLDPSLYDLLMRNLDELNAGIKEMGADAQELYDESIKDLPVN